MTEKLFFGAQVIAPWPNDMPKGRLIKSEGRHITLAFLGLTEWSSLSALSNQFPTPSFKIGIIGEMDRLFFLPESEPRVVSYHGDFFTRGTFLEDYQKELCKWLQEKGYRIDTRPFFPHITLARKPFDKNEWEHFFSPLPFYVSAIHLYESLGSLNYQPLWSHPLIPPFEELEHTADIAFLIRGVNMTQIFEHALLALSFKSPPLFSYGKKVQAENLNDVIRKLNRVIGIADEQIGSPFKAVSYHGTIEKNLNGLLEWEMIVDV